MLGDSTGSSGGSITAEARVGLRSGSEVMAAMVGEASAFKLVETMTMGGGVLDEEEMRAAIVVDWDCA